MSSIFHFELLKDMIEYLRGDQVLILFLVIGYLFGSIPWGLVVGKAFFNIDIRKYGSGNLGGTNAGRVLGKYYGFLVAFLDALKAFVPVLLVSLYHKDYAVMTGMMCAVGHCYPLFAEFKGGKAVASTFGYFLAVGLFILKDISIFIISLSLFVLILVITSYVSLASIISVSIASILTLLQPNIYVIVCTFLLSALIIYRHRSNIKRLIDKTENKVVVFKNKKI